MAKVLIVVTSHDQLGDGGEKTGFWLEELSAPYYALLDAGILVDVASTSGGVGPVDPKSEQPEWTTPSATRFQADAKAVAVLQKTLRAGSLAAKDYDAVYLAGGHGTMWDFPTDTGLARLLLDFNQAGKVIASVCHGVAALVPLTASGGAPLVSGRTITAFTDTEEHAVGLQDIVPFLLETRLSQLGARFEKGADWAPKAVQDGNLITGQNPASAEPVVRLLIKTLTPSEVMERQDA